MDRIGNGGRPDRHRWIQFHIDFFQLVDIQVNNADTIRVHNASTGTVAGNVTLVW